MGLSLNPLKKIWDQINPLDNGKTYQNQQGNGQQQSVIQQATHNAVTNAVGDVAKGAVNLGASVVRAPYDIVRGAAADVTDNSTALANARAAKARDYGVIGGATLRPAVQIAESIAHPFTSHTFTPSTTDQNLLLGGRPIQNITAGVQSTYNKRTDLSPVQRVLASAGYGVGQLASDYLAGKGASEGTVPGAVETAKNAFNAVKGGIGTPTITPAQPEPQTAITPPTEPVIVPKQKVVANNIVNPLQNFDAPSQVPKITVPALPKVATTNVDEISQAAQNLSEHYNSSINSSGNDLGSLVRDTKGHAAAGQLLASRLGRAIKNNLTKEEDQAVYDTLQGVKNDNLTPKAAQVVNTIKPLYDKSLEIRQGIDKNVNAVHEYAPRILRSTVKNAVRVAGGAASKIKSVLNLGDLESGFSKSRQYGKFVDESGNAVYGKPKDLGIVKHNDGTLTDTSGKTYKQVSTNTHELQQNLGLEYLNKSSHVSGLYHSDTARLQAKAAGLQELNANPTAHGLFTKDQIEAGNIDNMREVNVPGLKDSNGDNLFANAKDAKQLERDPLFGHPDARSLPGKVYDAATNTATQFIVLNPIFHGANQLVQSMIASGNISGLGGGWGRLAKGVFTQDTGDMYHYLNNGGHIPEYGSKLTNVLSRATGGATKASSKAMAAIETRLRVGLYKASVEGGMKPTEAIKNIDKFLGDQKQLSRATQRVTLFGHYFKTVGGALVDQTVHPLANKGATLNTAATAALFMGMTQQYQNFTGNKDAYVRMPGELGIIKELAKVPGEIKKGEVPTMITNRINPVAKEIGQQITNKDLFTGKPVTDSSGGRLGHAVTSLVAPTQQVSQVVSGRRNGVELASNQLGLYTPHAKGYQAAPNVSLLNKTVNGKVLPGTGEASQTAYFDGLNVAKKEVHGDAKTEAQFNNFLARSHDPSTGQSIQNTPSQSIQQSAALFDNAKLRATVQKFEQSQPSHDPMWDLPDDKLKQLFQYKEQFTGDAAKKFLLSQADQKDGSNWITDIAKKSSDFYSKIPAIPGSKSPISRSPAYPTFDGNTQSLLNAYNNGTSEDKTKLMSNYAGELSDAFNKIGAYTNQMRKAEGAPELNSYPKADAQTQAIINFYNKLPQNDGKKGGNATRFAWIQSHPDDYAKMQDYLTKSSMQSLISNASLAQFAGSTPNQKLLKDIKNIGKYDIAQYEDGNGNKTYAVNPKDAYAQSSSSSSGSSSSRRGINRLADTEQFRVSSPTKSSFRKGKISAKNGVLTSTKFKIASGTPTLNKKVALRKSKV